MDVDECFVFVYLVVLDSIDFSEFLSQAGIASVKGAHFSREEGGKTEIEFIIVKITKVFQLGRQKCAAA